MRLASFLALLGSFLALPAGAETPLRQVIDAELQAAWKREKVTPAGRADDATFLRRVYLDLVGTIPTADEATAFLDDTDPDKREKLIDRLLADPRFAAAPGRRLGPGAVRPQPAERRRDPQARRLPDLARRASSRRTCRTTAGSRELLLAEQDGRGAVPTSSSATSPRRPTEAVSRIFLGTQLQCARCHDHPYDDVDADATSTAWPGSSSGSSCRTTGGGNDRDVHASARRAPARCCSPARPRTQTPGKKGEPVKPKFLGGAGAGRAAAAEGLQGAGLPQRRKTLPKPAFSRKEKLAEWVTAPDNPYFARAAVEPRLGAVHGPRPGPPGRRPQRQERAALPGAARRADRGASSRTSST